MLLLASCEISNVESQTEYFYCRQFPSFPNETDVSGQEIVGRRSTVTGVSVQEGGLGCWKLERRDDGDIW